MRRMAKPDPFTFTGQIIRVLEGNKIIYHGFNRTIADLYLCERTERRLEVEGEPSTQEVIWNP